MLELYILGALALAWACAPHNSKRGRACQRAEKPAGKPCVIRDTSNKASVKALNLAQIEAMEEQINAACELGIALDRKAREQNDAVKRAKLAQQSADAYARAATIQARIDKMTLTV